MWPASALARFVMCIAITLACVGLTPAGASAAEEEQTDRSRRLRWDHFLANAADKMGFQFTYEIAIKPANIAYEDMYVDSNAKLASVDDLLQYLSNKLPWLSFERNQANRDIIHVIDKRLRGRVGYALEKKIDVKFAGTLDDLAWALHIKTGNLHGFRGAAIHETTTDFETEIAVEATSKTARQILTDAVPLRCYGPILWRARMATDGSDPAAPIDVNFYHNREDNEHGRSRWWWFLDLAHERVADGKSSRCYFTIETAYRAPVDRACCPVYFNDDEKFESPEALLAELTKRVGWLTAVKDARRPEIVHLIDKELLNVPGYTLAKCIDIDYQGSPDGLCKAISQRFANVGPLMGEHLDGPFQYHGDPETPIIVNAKGKPLRDVLTDCLPLERTYDVLWHARTWLRKDGPQTTVQYRFPR